MSNRWFTQMFPEVAEIETRSITLLNHPTLPADKYYFAEFYCDDPACDCRRVIVSVMAASRLDAPDPFDLATFSHAFEPPDPRSPIFVPGQTFIEPMHRQSLHAPALFDLFCQMVQDEAYAARLVRHYEMVKEAVGDRTHPVHKRLQGITGSSSPARAARQVPVRRGEKVGRNDPCPCGSGRKYKKCCLGQEAGVAAGAEVTLAPGDKLVEVDGEVLVTSPGVTEEEAREVAALFQMRDAARQGGR